MDVLGGDPATAIKGISEKLKEKVKESGLDAAEAFSSKLEELKDMMTNVPGDLMDKLKAAMEDFKKSVEDAMADPSSLAPSGLAAVAAWYGKAVVEKLKQLMATVEELFDSIGKVAADLAGPFKEIGDTMKEAMKGITDTVKGLADLPKQVQDLGDSCKGADDVKSIDTEPMKKALDTSGVDGPLDSLLGLKEKIKPLVTAVSGSVGRLSDFVDNAPDEIKNAFAVPPPLCCCTSVMMSQAPAPMQMMLDKVKSLKGFDLQPLVRMLQEADESMGGLDVSKVKDPVNKFAEAAKEQVGSLDKVVSAAKLAGNPAGAVTGALGGKAKGKLW